MPSLSRIRSQEALRQFGPAAEPEVIPLLKSADTFVVLSAIQVLETIGTEQSLPQLQTIAATRAAWFTQAQSAMRAIQSRAKK